MSDKSWEDTIKKAFIRTEVMIISQNKVLICQRKNNPEEYVFPGGHMDLDESDIRDTAVREVKEEVGYSIDKQRLLIIDTHVNQYGDEEPRITVYFLYQDDDLVNKKPEQNDDVRKTAWYTPSESEETVLDAQAQIINHFLPKFTKLVNESNKKLDNSLEMSEYLSWLGLIENN